MTLKVVLDVVSEICAFGRYRFMRSWRNEGQDGEVVWGN